MRNVLKVITLATAGCLTVLMAGAAVDAAEITAVASAGPLPNVMAAVIAMFERETGHQVAISFKAAPAIIDDAKQGAADLVVTNTETVADLAKSGAVSGDSTKLLMISKVGVAVKAGAPKPDIGTADKFKAALLAARAVGYSQGTSGQHFLAVLERLGIADAVKAKSVIAQGEPVGALIAKGAVDLGVQQVAELLPVAGIDFVGELPSDLQKKIPYSAGIPAKAKDQATARALIEYLHSQPVLALLKQKGMDLP